MALVDNIPLPGDPGEALIKGLTSGQDIMLKRAQAQREQARSQLPFGGDIPPGPAGQTVGLEMVKMLYGPNSDQYKQAKSMYDLQRQSDEARINYQNILSNSAPKRFSTSLGKTAQEYEDINRGYFPGTQNPLTPEQQKYYQGKYGLAMVKPTTDSDTRKKNLYARNMDITIGSIDPKALTSYSGIKGSAELIKDKLASAQGKTIPRYEAYEEAMTSAKTLAKQVRQFYGDSITPGVQKGLSELTNPTSWLRNPDVAVKNFNKFVDLLKSETKTYQQATQSPDIYTGGMDNAVSGAINNPGEEEALNNEVSDIENGLMTVQTPDGQIHKIYRDKLEAAKQKYPGLKVMKEPFSAAKI